MNKFDERLRKLPQQMQLLLLEIDTLNGQWIGGARLSPQALGRLKRSVLVTSTGASTRIEGSKLSDKEIEKLMRGLVTHKLIDRDEQEVQGYYELLQQVFNTFETIHLSENFIKQLHAQLLEYSEKHVRHRGYYKKQENRVEMKDVTGQVLNVLFKTTPAYLTEKETNELIVWTRDSLRSQAYHPLLIIANFIVEFLKIHPFLDGNGRMSRVLTNLLMLRAGYEYMPYVSHEKIIEENKTDYYIALRQSQASFDGDQETIESWARFFLHTVRMQAEQALHLLSRENVDDLLSSNQLIVWRFILSYDGDVSVRSITDKVGVARSTVKQSLERLLSLNRIERIGLGRSTRYRKL